VHRRDAEGLPDISWFHPDGSEMSDEDWESRFGKSVAVYLNGLGIPTSTRVDNESPTTHSCCASTRTMSPSTLCFRLRGSGRNGLRSLTPRRLMEAGRTGNPSMPVPNFR
jgi:hypothetical protein